MRNLDLLQIIESWIYPVGLLAILIFCLINARNRGIKYLAIGFGIGLISNLLWRFLGLFYEWFHVDNIQTLYKTFSHINVLFFIAESVFLFIGISILAKGSTAIKYYTGSFKDYIASKYVTSGDFGNIGLYIFLLITGTLLLVLGIFMGYQGRYSYSSNNIAVVMCLVGAILLIWAHIYFVVMLYRAWQFSINESFRLNLNPSIETPGKAVGYLFIPFFNFYWAFVAYGKLSRDLRAIADAKGVIVTMSNEIGVILAILCIVSIIPFVGYFTSVVALIIFPVFINQAIVQCTIIAEVNHKS